VTQIIGLVGFPRSGKDSLADKLVETGKWKKVAYADALKDLYLQARPCRWWDDRLPDTGENGYFLPVQDRNGLELAKTEDPQTRFSLQRFGQSIRNLSPNFFVDAARMTVLGHQANGYNVVVTDIRYSNEEEMVLNWPGKVIGISRKGHGAVNDHVSESNTANILARTSLRVFNNGTIDAAYEQLERIIR